MASDTHVYVNEADTLRLVWKLTLDSKLQFLKQSGYRDAASLSALIAAVEDLIHAEVPGDV